MNRLYRWKSNIIANITKHPIISLLIVAMYLAFFLTLGQLLK